MNMISLSNGTNPIPSSQIMMPDGESFKGSARQLGYSQLVPSRETIKMLVVEKEQ